MSTENVTAENGTTITPKVAPSQLPTDSVPITPTAATMAAAVSTTSTTPTVQAPAPIAPPPVAVPSTTTTTSMKNEVSNTVNPAVAVNAVNAVNVMAAPSKVTESAPSGYGAVSGSSHSVAATRHNPLSAASAATSKEEEKTDTVTVVAAATATTNTVTASPAVATTTSTTTTSSDQQQTQQQQSQQQQQQSQQQQQLLAAQQAMSGPLNPMLAANMALLQQQQQAAAAAAAAAAAVSTNPGGKRLNKYGCWPPAEQQIYSSFHPLGWPIDPEYQYQISNYLGPSPAANNMMAGGLGMGGGLGMNPLIAAQAAALNNPVSSLLAAQAAFNPLLAAGGGLGALGGAAAAAALSGGASSNIGGKQWSLFVFHLPEDIDDHGLLQLFAPYGAMRSNVMRHETGRSRGFGFVHFNTRHEAQIAIDMMNGHQIGRKRLRVSFKREEPHDGMRGPPRNQMPLGGPPQGAAAVGLGGLPPNATAHLDAKDHGGN